MEKGNIWQTLQCIVFENVNQICPTILLLNISTSAQSPLFHKSLLFYKLYICCSLKLRKSRHSGSESTFTCSMIRNTWRFGGSLECSEFVGLSDFFGFLCELLGFLFHFLFISIFLIFLCLRIFLDFSVKFGDLLLIFGDLLYFSGFLGDIFGISAWKFCIFFLKVLEYLPFKIHIVVCPDHLQRSHVPERLKGLHLEVRALRAPRLLVFFICLDP